MRPKPNQYKSIGKGKCVITDPNHTFYRWICYIHKYGIFIGIEVVPYEKMGEYTK